MTKPIYILILTLLFAACKSQSQNEGPDKLVGGPCEGCEAIYEYGQKTLTATDTLPGFTENQPKLNITGTVFHNDGKTPAGDVIVYIYHTNRKGLYAADESAKDWARRHGRLRGWIKTVADGKYSFFTIRPAAYPGGSEPEHIHITIKEPDKNAYYMDEFVFDDDPFLTKDHRKKLQHRGGSGIVKPELLSDIYYVKRDIILGLNIPDYR